MFGVDTLYHLVVEYLDLLGCVFQAVLDLQGTQDKSLYSNVKGLTAILSHTLEVQVSVEALTYALRTWVRKKTSKGLKFTLEGRQLLPAESSHFLDASFEVLILILPQRTHWRCNVHSSFDIWEHVSDLEEGA